MLDLEEHVFHVPSSQQQGSVYNLIGKVVHIGHSPRSGHYVAHVKHTSGKWFRVSDTKVDPLPDQATADDSATNAYLLFYRRDRAATPH